MKLVAISLVSWLLGLLLILSQFTDVNGATVTSLIMAALVFSLAYAPSLAFANVWAAANQHCCFRLHLLSYSTYLCS
jgi:uncharacterized membrane protein